MSIQFMDDTIFNIFNNTFTNTAFQFGLYFEMF